MTELLRTIKKRQGDELIEVGLSDLKPGDVFIVFDDDEQVGVDWLAEGEPMPCLETGVWGIVAKVME